MCTNTNYNRKSFQVNPRGVHIPSTGSKVTDRHKFTWTTRTGQKGPSIQLPIVSFGKDPMNDRRGKGYYMIVDLDVKGHTTYSGVVCTLGRGGGRRDIKDS